ncbi:YoaK family protein [Salinisphaera sp. T31B1]|uniref:YoaK family protein n=1 Tax=Salinisphaera sp. T31B1 TaxID=727963 RepID=UPI00334139FD
MINHRRRDRVIAAGLTLLAGYVDALGFLTLGGYFLSFMSGNSTRLGVGFVDSLAAAALPLALIGLFVTGVILGSLVGRVARHRRRTAVVALVAALLALGAAGQTVGLTWAAIAPMALAMGAENAVFERNGEVSIGLTYMTGTLVKLGQRVTDALLGGQRWAWCWYLLLWSALVAGTVIGAFVHHHVGLAGLWPAAIAAALLAWTLDRFAAERPTPSGTVYGPACGSDRHK